MDADEIRAVLLEYKLNSCDVSIRQPDATLEELIDVIEGNRVYMPALYVLNKIDAISIEELDLLYKIPNSVPISSSMWLNIDELIDVSLLRPHSRLSATQTDVPPLCLFSSRCGRRWILFESTPSLRVDYPITVRPSCLLLAISPSGFSSDTPFLPHPCSRTRRSQAVELHRRSLL